MDLFTKPAHLDVLRESIQKDQTRSDIPGRGTGVRASDLGHPNLHYFQEKISRFTGTKKPPLRAVVEKKEFLKPSSAS
jgi:hypothetical protein